MQSFDWEDEATSLMDTADKAGLMDSLKDAINAQYSALKVDACKDGASYVFTLTGYEEMNCNELLQFVCDWIGTNTQNIECRVGLDVCSGDSASVHVQPLNISGKLMRKRARACCGWLWTLFFMLTSIVCLMVTLMKFESLPFGQCMVSGIIASFKLCFDDPHVMDG